MRLRHVDDGQHREDESLQRDDENVEHCPAPLQHPAERTPDNPTGEQQRYQNEDHFAGIHVAEQPQSKRQRFGDQGDAFEEQVDREQEFRERVKGKLCKKTSNTLLLDAEVNDQHKDV